MHSEIEMINPSKYNLLANVAAAAAVAAASASATPWLIPRATRGSASLAAKIITFALTVFFFGGGGGGRGGIGVFPASTLQKPRRSSIMYAY